MQDLSRRLRTGPSPSVCAIHGHAVGGGLELALACDIVVAAPDASLAFPDVRAGVAVGGGATFLLPRLIGLARARALLLTGEPISGRHAFEIGLVAAVSDEPLAEAERIAATLAGLPRAAVRRIRHALDRGLDGSFESALGAERGDMLATTSSPAFAGYRERTGDAPVTRVPAR